MANRPGVIPSRWPTAQPVVADDGTVSQLTGGALTLLGQVATPITASAHDSDGVVAVASGEARSRVFLLGASTPVEVTLPAPAVVDALAFRDGAVLAGTRAGEVLSAAAGSGTFVAATTSPTGGGVTALLGAPGLPAYATVGGTNGGLFRSDDGADSFAAVGPGTGGTFLRGGCLEPTTGAVGLVAEDAVYVSTNQGDAWQPLAGAPAGLRGAALPLATGCTMAQDGDATLLWLPTLTRGVWLTRLP